MVAFLQLSIVVVELLHSIVREVNHWLVNAFLTQSKLIGRGPYIAFFEEEAALIMRDQNPKANVKLPLIYEERLLDVLLDHEYFRSYVGCQIKILLAALIFNTISSESCSGFHPVTFLMLFVLSDSSDGLVGKVSDLSS